MIQEAVTIRHELAVTRPDEFRAALVKSLDILAFALADLMRPEESLAASQEAHTIPPRAGRPIADA